MPENKADKMSLMENNYIIVKKTKKFGEKWRNGLKPAKEKKTCKY